MINIIKKDFWLLFNWGTFVVFAVIGFLAATGGEMYPVVSIAIYLAIFLPVGIAYCEDRYKGQKLITSLPVKRKEIIQTRYVEGVVFSLIGYLVSMVANNFITFVRWQEWVPFSVSEFLTSIILILLLLAIFYPINVLFGMISAYISFGVFVVVMMFQQPLIYYMDKTGVFKEAWMYSVILSIGVLVLYGLSYILSKRIYQQMDL